MCITVAYINDSKYIIQAGNGLGLFSSQLPHRATKAWRTERKTKTDNKTLGNV